MTIRCAQAKCLMMPTVEYGNKLYCADHNPAQWAERALLKALRPFVEAYRKTIEPIGDSDLYPEQPRHITVTMGDCRRADALLRSLEE